MRLLMWCYRLAGHVVGLLCQHLVMVRSSSSISLSSCIRACTMPQIPAPRLNLSKFTRDVHQKV
jgi:hypothetical protein